RATGLTSPDCPWLAYIFFFSSRRRHTRFSRDWSSDVCSSDLVAGLVALPLAMVGGWSMLLHRRQTARSITSRLERVAAGDARVIWQLQREGLLRDTLRGVVLSTLGIAMILAAEIGRAHV